MSSTNPILNSPYLEPKLHYSTAADGTLDYDDVRQGRRVFVPDTQVIPIRQGPQKAMFDVNDEAESYSAHQVNLMREEVGKWRAAAYPNTTRVTKELLHFWFLNPDRTAVRKLFFAQQEAIETAIWLNEVAEKSNAGQSLLTTLKNATREEALPRIAFKMATGSGKTVVMAALIVYHYFNRREYRGDTRFADHFLIVAPGITIRDRLGVLYVDSTSGDRTDYYRVRDLVPRAYESHLAGLNAKLTITNYHSFDLKVLQGNKRSPFDGKIGKDGKKTNAFEDPSLMIRRVLKSVKPGSRLLVINDEAHHCYKPKASGRISDFEESDENEKAALWYTGLSYISEKFKVQSVYDLSATPYYLNGSGYEPYSLFPWVVSDFGLIEAIESGLVKIPFLPESDSTQELEMPVLRNLYDHVKEELPRKGQRKKRQDGELDRETAPVVPDKVKLALHQFVDHYQKYLEGHRQQQESKNSLFTSPPVMIMVCNNTAVSKEIYKYVAGYEETTAEGEVLRVADGHFPVFSNYDPVTKHPKSKSPTLLIDSDALENSDQVNDEFRKIFTTEIVEFKREYARLYGQGAADRITDSEILREVVNTVGKPGKLGAHIRCVVSVSMLTEGWDANTVTHIMGLRAFGSQLLCEQVAGRALRRVHYYLQGYDKDGNPTNDKNKTVIEKFPPEYAHIIGVPFKLFKGGKGTPGEPPNHTTVKALEERRNEYEIRFPNVVGYRNEPSEDALRFDFTGIEDFEIDGSQLPIETTLASPISSREEVLTVGDVLDMRDQEIVFRLAADVAKYHFAESDGQPAPGRFAELLPAAKVWYDSKVKLLNISDPAYKRLVILKDAKARAAHIARGINPHRQTTEFVRPVLNFHNRMGSTVHVNGQTTKDVYWTKKSHVNAVPMDSDWEGIAAKTLEEMPQVISYVKNDFLGFSIPYMKDGKEGRYFPDFLVRLDVNGTEHMLILEITGFNKDKAEKKWTVERQWLPAVNAVKEQFKWPKWHFAEIANDIRDIRNQLAAVINGINL